MLLGPPPRCFSYVAAVTEVSKAVRERGVEAFDEDKTIVARGAGDDGADPSGVRALRSVLQLSGPRVSCVEQLRPHQVTRSLQTHATQVIEQTLSSVAHMPNPGSVSWRSHSTLHLSPSHLPIPLPESVLSG